MKKGVKHFSPQKLCTQFYHEITLIARQFQHSALGFAVVYSVLNLQ